jgi:photosystem II stability/assembly factor-like uncharacterized protein
VPPGYPPAVAFVDASHGSMLFESGLAQSTVDGGRTWSDFMLPGVPVHYPNSLVFSSSSRAWLTYGGGLFTSGDAGAHWDVVAGARGISSILRTTWIDDAHGWVVASPTNNDDFGLYLYATQDGGSTWKSVPLPDLPVISVAFENANVGIVSIGEIDRTTHILRTADGGATWTQVGSSSTEGATVSRTGTHTWWIAEAGSLQRSADDGVTWTSLPTNFSDMAHVIGGDDTTVYVIDDAGGVSVSIDAGAHWSWDTPYPDVDITAGFALDANTVWTTTHDGAVLATTTGGH